MKCALPGMYGRVVPIKSDTMADILKSDYESLDDILKKAQTKYEDLMVDFEESQKEIDKVLHKIDESQYDQIVEYLRQKDKEEHE